MQKNEFIQVMENIVRGGNKKGTNIHTTTTISTTTTTTFSSSRLVIVVGGGTKRVLIYSVVRI